MLFDEHVVQADTDADTYLTHLMRTTIIIFDVLFENTVNVSVLCLCLNLSPIACGIAFILLVFIAKYVLTIWKRA